MLVFDKMLVGGVKFVLDKVAKAVEGELNDDSRLREELLAAQMRVELGEMTQEEFAALEDQVLLRIREIRAARGENVGAIEFGGGGGSSADDEQGGVFGGAEIAGIDADFVADDYYGEAEEVAPAHAIVDVAPEPVPEAAPARSTARKKNKKKPQKRTSSRRKS